MPVLLAVLLALLPLTAMADVVAIMPVKMLDTSGEARDQQADHDRRTALIAQAIAAELDGAVTIDAAEVATCQPETTECLLALARDRGADRALFVVAQKTSTLILQLFANLADTSDGRLILNRDLNFRGDNDDAWRRAGQFLGRQMRDAG